MDRKLGKVSRIMNMDRKNYSKNNTSKHKRNAPCPCGSGLKYKKCCGASNMSFEVKPQNKPEVISNHMVSRNGGKTWERRQGTLAVIIHGVKTEELDKQIYEFIAKAIQTSRDNKNDILEKKLIDCRHKLHAVKYHLSTIKIEIEERIKEYKNNHSAGSGVSFEMENPRLVYETEALLFQTKSSLDLLTQTLGCLIPPLKTMNTFKKKDDRAGGKVIIALQKNGYEELGDLFEKQRTEWIQEVVEMRDNITHYSELKGFNCFIEEPYKGKETVEIHYPTMPSGIKVDEFCQNTFDRLLELFKSTLSKVLIG